MADELWLIGLVRAKTHPSTANAVATFPTREGKIRYNVIIMEETNVLQSPVWADFQRRLGRKVITKKTKKYSYVAIVEKGAFSKRLYCPLGPIAGNLDGFQEAVCADFAFFYQSVARDHYKKLPLGIMPMLSLRNTRL